MPTWLKTHSTSGPNTAVVIAVANEGGSPAAAEVLIGGRRLTARAHAIREGRRGPQVLIDCHGRLVWVTATRVRKREPH